MIDTEAQRAGRENLSTPLEMVWLLGLLHQGKLLDTTHTVAVLEILKYPKDTALRRGLASGVELASKTGGLAGVACESGIVLLAGRPYAIAVMTTYGNRTTPEAADAAITRVSRIAFDYFERLARSNPLGVRVQ
jgi:beta-lactamase class A